MWYTCTYTCTIYVRTLTCIYRNLYLVTQSSSTGKDDDDNYDEEEEEEEKVEKVLTPPPPLITVEKPIEGMANISTTPLPTHIEPMDTAPPTGVVETQKGEDESIQFPLLQVNMTKEELLQKVKTLFPTFKPNSILRFSTLISPKPSSLPNVWKDCVKPNRHPPDPDSAPKEWVWQYGPIPDKEFWNDQTERFLMPIGEKRDGTEEEGGAAVVIDSESREWRYGPAKIWYDQLNLPENDCGYLDYGFKMKVS